MYKFLIRFFNKLSILPWFNFKYPLKLNGRQIVIPIISGTGYLNMFAWDPWMRELISKINPDNCFIDIGANIGQTLINVKLSSPDIPFIGF